MNMMIVSQLCLMKQRLFGTGLPSITPVDQFSSIVIENGERPERICFIIGGRPEPSLILKKDGAEVNASEYNRKSDCIRFQRVSFDDSGDYTVEVSNCFGQDFLEFNLTVKGIVSVCFVRFISFIRDFLSMHLCVASLMCVFLWNV